jgi:hypothetical protein
MSVDDLYTAFLPYRLTGSNAPLRMLDDDLDSVLRHDRSHKQREQGCG